jgi:hypothetical protein
MHLVVMTLRFDTLTHAAVFMASLPDPMTALRPVPGAVDIVAGSDAGLVAVAGTTARVLDPLGHPLRTVGTPQAPPTPPDAAIPRSMNALDVPSWPELGVDSDWGGIYDEDDIDDSDDPRLADETVPGAWDFDQADRRRPPPMPTRQPDRGKKPSVAVGANHAWIGTSDGLWRFDLPSGGGIRVLRSSGAGISAVAASPDGATVAIVDGSELLRSRDTGGTFEVVAPVALPARALAATSSGAVLILDPDELHMFRPGRNQGEKVGVDRAVDVVACGSQVAVLADGAFYSISGAPDYRVALVGPVPIGVERIACAVDGRTWIAWGHDTLWTSANRGRPWTRRNDLTQALIEDAAISADTIWIATPAALVPVPLLPTHCSNDGTAALNARSTPGSASLSSKPRLGMATLSPRVECWWCRALPRIELLLAAARTPTRRELRGLVFLTFVLDPSSATSAREARFVAQMARRRLEAEAARPISLPVGESSQGDPVSVEERHARIEILEDPQ